MKDPIINKNIEHGVFVKYYNGYYQFVMDSGDTIIFEGISSLAKNRFDLRSDRFKGKSFEITYTEHIEDDDEDFIVYRIDSIKLT